jgi:hypothetical protein
VFTRFDLYAVGKNAKWVPRRDGNLLASEMSFSQDYTTYVNDTHPNAVGNTGMAIHLSKYFLSRYRLKH